MGNLALTLEKVILRLAETQMRAVIEDFAEDDIRDLVAGTVSEVVGRMDLPRLVMAKLSSLVTDDEEFVLKVEEAVESVLDSQLNTLVEKRIRSILCTEMLQSQLDQLVNSRIGEVIQSAETTASLDNLVKVLITASIERMSQQLLNRP